MASIKQKAYIDQIEKENRLRLEWFRRNIDRLKASVETPNSRTVPQELIDEVKESRRLNNETREKYPIVIAEDVPPPQYDEDAILNIMRPVDPAIKKILYQGNLEFFL